MTRSISRIVLTMLALVVMFAGSSKLNRSSANVPPAGKCQDYCGCPGGTYICCIIHLPDGTDIECGMP
jgi:hypothetical protein